jgi:hypothetical protein
MFPSTYYENYSFRLDRRTNAVKAIYEAVSSNAAIKDFEISICVNDGFAESSEVASFGLVWSNDSGTLPLSEMEWDFRSLQEWGVTHSAIKQWRLIYPWKNRTSKAVFRGSLRRCYPPSGDEAAIFSPAVVELMKKKIISCGTRAVQIYFIRRGQLGVGEPFEEVYRHGKRRHHAA